MVVLRFVVGERDARTGQPTGLLAIAYALMRSGRLGEAQAGALRDHLAWFEAHVPIPERFARERNVSHRNTHGVAWIKPDATAAIACLHAIARIVEDQGYSVDVLKTTRPGYVVHEDDLQLVAEPFHGEPQ